MSVSASTSCEDDEEKEASLRYHQAGEEAGRPEDDCGHDGQLP